MYRMQLHINGHCRSTDLQFHRCRKNHFPDNPRNSTDSKELVVALAWCVSVASLHVPCQNTNTQCFTIQIKTQMLCLIFCSCLKSSVVKGGPTEILTAESFSSIFCKKQAFHNAWFKAFRRCRWWSVAAGRVVHHNLQKTWIVAGADVPLYTGVRHKHHSEDLYLSGTLTMPSTYRIGSAIWKQCSDKHPSIACPYFTRVDATNIWGGGTAMAALCICIFLRFKENESNFIVEASKQRLFSEASNLKLCIYLESAEHGFSVIKWVQKFFLFRTIHIQKQDGLGTWI